MRIINIFEIIVFTALMQHTMYQSEKYIPWTLSTDPRLKRTVTRSLRRASNAESTRELAVANCEKNCSAIQRCIGFYMDNVSSLSNRCRLASNLSSPEFIDGEPSKTGGMFIKGEPWYTVVTGLCIADTDSEKEPSSSRAFEGISHSKCADYCTSSSRCSNFVYFNESCILNYDVDSANLDMPSCFKAVLYVREPSIEGYLLQENTDYINLSGDRESAPDDVIVAMNMTGPVTVTCSEVCSKTPNCAGFTVQYSYSTADADSGAHKCVLKSSWPGEFMIASTVSGRSSYRKLLWASGNGNYGLFSFSKMI
jgi:PAN domain